MVLDNYKKIKNKTKKKFENINEYKSNYIEKTAELLVKCLKKKKSFQ